MILPICIALSGFVVFVVCCVLDVLFPAAREHVRHVTRQVTARSETQRALPGGSRR